MASIGETIVQAIISTPPSSLGTSPGGTKCPWAPQSPASSPPIDSINLADIMSEQLAEDLQDQEQNFFLKEVLSGATGATKESMDFARTLEELVNSNPGDTGSDELIAQMLQLQYDKEADSNLKKVEQHFNGKSKVSVSLANYLVSPTDDAEDSEEEDFREPKAWDSFEAHEKAFPAMSGRGYVRVNNTVVTKHDMTMSQRRNACRVMEFPPGIQTGDGASFDMKLSNNVFNRLKVYSRAEETRRTRLHDKSEKSTSDWAIDQKTKLMLYKMVNNEVLSEVHGIVSTGKESIVVYAKCPKRKPEDDSSEDMAIPAVELGASALQELVFDEEECAIKIFKTSLNEFKSRDKYIKDDYRFKDRFSKQNPRKVIHMWAEKEMHNLNRMVACDVPCPQVILLKRHILVLSFIGKDGKPAPKLKEVKFTQDEDLREAYDQTINGMKKLYNDCKLVHSDLSEFNILWHEGKCYFIDVSQSVEPAHPNALEFLYRDCTNICTFFSKRRLENIHTPESLFTDISGYSLSAAGGPDVLSQIQNYERNMELLTFALSDKSYPFEYCWEQSQRDDSD